MSVKIARIFFIVLLAVSISGCASILTRMGPLESKLENGEVSVGEFSKYKFSGGIVANEIYLEKTPQCTEIVKKVHVMQKYPRGRVFIWAEMLLFGLGIIDAANVEAICTNSRVELPLAKFETANFLVCGEKEPAANEVLVIEDKQRTFHKQAQTDAKGNLNLEKILFDENRVLNLSIRLASDQTEAVSFIYEPGK